jgi:UPF0176 protein
VYQLQGGIIEYGKQAGGEHFDGTCYVFDERITVPVNVTNPKVVAHCSHCQASAERMINCANADCNTQFIVCESCLKAHQGCCTVAECTDAPRRRAFDGHGQYYRGDNSKAYLRPQPAIAEVPRA